MHGVRKLFHGALALAVAVGVAAPACATTLMRSSLERLVADNATIVLGEVVDTDSHWNEGHTFILTDVTFAVHEVLKGDVRDREITVTIMGGRIGDLTTLIVAGAELIPGNSYVLFLNREDLPGLRGALTVRDHVQGVFDLRIANDGLRAVSQANGHPLVQDAAGLADAAGGEEGYPLTAMTQSIREQVNRPDHNGREVQ